MDQKITDLIYRIDNLVPKDVCQSLINFYEENEKLTSPEDSYKVKENKKSFDNYKCLNISQLRNTNKNFEEPFKIISQYLSIMLTNYVLHIQKEICPTFSSMFINQTDNIRILKYNEGAYIGDHSDVGPSIRASCTLNLNEDYEGGEFRFFDGRVKHKFKTGDAMLFPAEPIWIHGTEPVTKGTRYSINCFLKNDNIR
tara:strand:- start:559 stop:1152 length:594 start_codon:yes stop_codon:yes gene_type:complete